MSESASEKPDTLDLYSLGLGLNIHDRGTAYVEALTTYELKPDSYEIECLTFIRHRELRMVALELLDMHPSFSRAVALRHLVEADEAMLRAGVIDSAIDVRAEREAATKAEREAIDVRAAEVIPEIIKES